jgi:hypothetical protein
LDQQRDLDPVCGAELGQQPGYVCLDGGQAHVQLGGDVGVGVRPAPPKEHRHDPPAPRRGAAAGHYPHLLAARTAITLPLLAARHIPAGLTGPSAATIIAGGAIATALTAAIGIGAGAIIRNQTGAVIAVLALLYVAEPLLGFVPHLGTAIQRYGLGGLAAASTHTTGFPATAHLLGQPAAALVLAGYATVALLAGAALLKRRDITT